MKRRHFLWFGLGAIACLLAIVFGCTPAPKTPLRVGMIIWPGYEPLFLAQQINAYQDQPIELRDYPSLMETRHALRNGDIEVAALTMDETLLLAQSNPDIRVILITDFSNGADALMAKPEIKTLADLKGHKIGVESNGLGGYFLTRVLDIAKLSLEDIQIVPLSVPEHEQAYEQNLVDAVITFEPVRSNLLQAGAKILFDSTQLPKEIVDVLVTNKDMIAERPKELNALLSGWFKALEYNQKDPQDGAKRMSSREQISPQQFINSLKLLTIPDRQTNLALLSQTDPSLMQSVERLAKVMLDKKLLMQEVNLEFLFDQQILKSLP